MQCLPILLVKPVKDLPIGSDGQSMVLIESMAQKVPMIATHMADIPDLNIQGETGRLAEPNDPISLADCLERVLRNQDL